MVARHGIQLAVFLIKSHFGELVSKVCECLLNRGSLSFQELVRFAELDPDDKSRNSLLVKKSLLVLIQHNCVQAFSVPKLGGPGGLPKLQTKYMILFDNVLHRLRFAKFLAIVRNDLGPKCEALLEGLLQHGRLTFDQLVLRATSKQPEATQDCVRTNFNELVQSHYIERCPRADPFIAPTPETKPGRRGSKSSVEIPTIEEQAILAASLSDIERFSGISPATNAGVEEKDEKLSEHSPSVSVGNKRKREIEVDSDVQATISETEILWRANFEKFVHCLKKKVTEVTADIGVHLVQQSHFDDKKKIQITMHKMYLVRQVAYGHGEREEILIEGLDYKACVENIRSRLGVDAAVILEAMIESNCDQKATENSSVTATMDAILEGVRRKPGGNAMALEQVRIILDQLGCHLCSEDTGALYTIDLKGVIEICRNDEVESLVLRRYGKEAFRILRLLVKDGGKKETDMIADTTFIEKKENQVLLYKLWKDEYLDVERVVTAVGKQLTYFLWEVNKKKLLMHIVNDMYHAALNLSKRAGHMIEQDPEILLPKQGLPEKLQKEKTAEKRRWMILQSSLAKLDDALMLFHDF
ncbi:DNA-directed RNA polymerase III subunit RPC3 isoform X1 [Asparagus officinalis]|uniref:DNA-directed RNA polymerase III subunit RPC3 isoform X1 n=1 Tax=Asparagus officinalis TaxID=4686 RepID=UPI00098DF9B7|nr:DNA-directed RNA polymerase III subunit RPC3 isoform X1 [Asparagus officinalis]XP_020264044.1 DNA-directed RNA polymerase III subunit RPC3 isoform X1 [Asparagus officinalis]